MCVSLLHYALLILHTILHLLGTAIRQVSSPTTLKNPKTVLVTTGRMAKTLHTVRCLKSVGCRVIVSDYSPISASRFSLCCDKFIQLPPLDTSHLDAWVENFRMILLENNVDLVIPVSTINEVLFTGVAKDELQKDPKLEHVKWICPGLEEAIVLDDRVLFAGLCQKYGVQAPQSGQICGREGIESIVEKFEDGIMLKRIESSTNRSEEIVHVKKQRTTNGKVDIFIPNCVNPTKSNPWQWQQFITGMEYSAWYIVVDGKVTFSAAYKSAADLMHFDYVPVDQTLDKSLIQMMHDMKLTGQFAFDYIVDRHGDACVIECNPRASSILETVSNTPNWADAFFGVDMRSRTCTQSVGFLYHLNSWPFANRVEGHLQWNDPLPFFAAQIVWPLDAYARKVLKEGRKFGHIDVNICKIITGGESIGRNLDVFRRRLVLQTRIITQAEEVEKK